MQSIRCAMPQGYRVCSQTPAQSSPAQLRLHAKIALAQRDGFGRKELDATPAIGTAHHEQFRNSPGVHSHGESL
jgi:hypothetical protein